MSARAAVSGGVAYFPDWSGHLYAMTPPPAQRCGASPEGGPGSRTPVH
ncbi:MAG: hypothetical protein J2P22_08520 [Nocardioides sp.]|nr:hypothetical protein [Nocardioides sp.]